MSGCQRGISESSRRLGFNIIVGFNFKPVAVCAIVFFRDQSVPVESVVARVARENLVRLALLVHQVLTDYL